MVHQISKYSFQEIYSSSLFRRFLEVLNKVLQAELEPIRERRKMWEAKLPEVAEILQQGTKAARAKAQETMKDVRHAMRIDYFNEEGLF